MRRETVDEWLRTGDEHDVDFGSEPAQMLGQLCVLDLGAADVTVPQDKRQDHLVWARS